MELFLDESAECERCGRMDDLKARDGQMVCYDCREELDREAWDAKHDFPLTGHRALLYADDLSRAARQTVFLAHGPNVCWSTK